jgi:hypothetical protein
MQENFQAWRVSFFLGVREREREMGIEDGWLKVLSQGGQGTDVVLQCGGEAPQTATRPTAKGAM